MLTLAVDAFGLDEIAGIEPFGTTDERGYNLGTESFSINHDGIMCLLA